MQPVSLTCGTAARASEVFFFVIIPPKYTCGGLTTGAAAPYTATVKQVGKYMVQDTPLPPDVSTRAGNLKGIYGSLIAEHLNWKNLTTKVKGKTVGYNSQWAAQARPGRGRFSSRRRATTGRRASRSLAGSEQVLIS